MAPQITGVVLAAGAGSRFGYPKIQHGQWLDLAVRSLAEGGCGTVLVVTGAARVPLPGQAQEVWNPAWHRGQGTSIAEGLEAALGDPDTAAVAIRLVDTPDITAACVARVLDAARQTDGHLHPTRATYEGTPGHPVLLPRHTGIQALAYLATADPEKGLGPFLTQLQDLRGIECADVASGLDVDFQHQLAGAPQAPGD